MSHSVNIQDFANILRSSQAGFELFILNRLYQVKGMSGKFLLWCTPISWTLTGEHLSLFYYFKKDSRIWPCICMVENLIWGLPWWSSGWESACQCRGHGFVPRSGKIPHAAEQLGPWATTTEPACLEPVLRNKRGRDGERPAHRDEEWPPLATTGGSPCTETKTQHSQINK